MNAHGTFAAAETVDESLTTLVARSVLERAIVLGRPHP